MTQPTHERIPSHGVRPMTGRDPNEAHRVSTPLELFFDLTFAIAFGVAGNQAAHLVSERHFGGAVLGFGFAVFAIVWAWINFTWFASAFDTDDWVFRALTMLQMVGVLVLAVGLTPLFHSIDEGAALANGTMIIGYVIMRIAMVAQWLRAATQCEPALRRTCLTYAVGIVITQVGWVGFYFLHARGLVAFVGWVVMLCVEGSVPYAAECRTGVPTPWHPHHIGERFGLLAIIALGECLIGTIATLSAALEHGWTVDVALVGLAGTGLAFGLWWLYFLLPSGPALEERPDKGFRFGYIHIVVFGAIAAIGAGLHVTATVLTGESHLSTLAAVLTVAVPVGVYTVSLAALFHLLVGLDPSVAGAKVLEVVILLVAVGLAAAGVALPVCLLVVMAGPIAGVVTAELGAGRTMRGVPTPSS